jgi:hypothetical protein
MTKFGNKYGTTNRQGVSPIRSAATPTARNHDGTLAYSRDAKSDLFLLGVTNMVGEDTFYESASDRDNRFAQLVHQVTAEDPDWVERFIPWLRNTANMRSASVAAACEYVKAGGPNARKVINSAISRADEPAEVLAYWIGVYGKPIPSSVKRGVNDAVSRIWNQFSVAKYDGNGKTFRMGDVVNLTHPKPKDEMRKALYKYTLDSRFGETPDVSQLEMLALRRKVNAGEITRDQLLANPDLMKDAGMTWEALSGLGQMDARAWEAVIPNMGYMALLRNLRNFEQAGISAKSVKYVNDYLTDPEKVAGSRQLPFRFWSAYKNTNGLQYAASIETALDLSLQNMPSFSGKTLILTDTSGSMGGVMSGKSTMSRLEAAALFAVALALKGEEVDLFGFADYTFRHNITRGSSVLREMDAFTRRVGEAGYGTAISNAMTQWDGHDRVVHYTYIQANGRYDRANLRKDTTTTSNRYYGTAAQEARPVTGSAKAIPTQVPIFGFNLAGYATTQVGGANEYELGGLTDNTFKLIPLLEARGRGEWPF